MRICDMCLTALTNKTKKIATIEANNIFDIDKNYVLCPKCARKLEKYIRFEQAKSKEKVGMM